MQTKVLTFIAGIVVGGLIGWALTGTAHAATNTAPTGMVIVSKITVDWSTYFIKVYDYDNGTVCYLTSVWSSGGGGGVSCLKN